MTERRLRYGKGRGSIEITGDLHDLIMRALKNSHPDIMRELEKSISQVEKTARDEWPVRQAKYGKSKNSRGQITSGYRIVPPTTVEAFMRNSAPYAYAIHAGPDSATSVSEGDNIVEKLIFEPFTLQSERIVGELAKLIIKKMR